MLKVFKSYLQMITGVIK